MTVGLETPTMHFEKAVPQNMLSIWADKSSKLTSSNQCKIQGLGTQSPSAIEIFWQLYSDLHEKICMEHWIENMTLAGKCLANIL